MSWATLGHPSRALLLPSHSGRGKAELPLSPARRAAGGREGAVGRTCATKGCQGGRAMLPCLSEHTFVDLQCVAWLTFVAGLSR